MAELFADSFEGVEAARVLGRPPQVEGKGDSTTILPLHEHVVFEQPEVRWPVDVSINELV